MPPGKKLPALAALVLASALASLGVFGVHRLHDWRLDDHARSLWLPPFQGKRDREAQHGAPADFTVPFPAESGVPSQKEYALLFPKAGFSGDWETLFQGLVFTNASENDPPDTALIVSRNYYDQVFLKEERPTGRFTIVYLDGTLRHLTPGETADPRFNKLPPRDPPFLKP